MAGPRTAAFGKFLSTFGAMWMLAALITGFIAMGGQGVPFLPGILIYVTGKTLTALGKRGVSEQEDHAEEERSAPFEPKPVPPPASQPRPVARRNEYLEEHTTPEELPDLEEAILEPPPPMTSEEMIAEARRRFDPRPVDEQD